LSASTNASEKSVVGVCRVEEKAAIKRSGRRNQGYQGAHEIPGLRNIRKAMSISYLTYGSLGLINSVESIPAETSRVSLFDGNGRFITLFITTGQ
jgi:hypothetical protein